MVTAADIRVVLVETSHPGNIGAVARAMKNMGLEQLVLVRPKDFPHSEASARASGATDVLERAIIAGSVEEAVADCGFVVATTARDRDQNIRVLDVREGAQRVVGESARGPVALLFGNERTGLTNQELSLAHLLLRIPASPVYPSLNLAMAVQLVAYEVYRARGARHETSPPAVPFASAAEMERLYAHLAQVLEEIGFRDRTTSGTHLMERIRRFINRAELDQNEANILRGILTAVQAKRRRAGSSDLPIYLDHAASTPIDPEVQRALEAASAGVLGVGNPSATTHLFGVQAAAAIEQARAEVASLIGADPTEIVFTSGATESDNLALLGIARGRASHGRHIVISKIEHKAVLDPVRRLEKQGWQITRLEPTSDGRIDPASLAAVLRADTQLVSIMHANNEVGVVQDIASIAAICRERGVLLHTDAAQTVGKLPIELDALGVDLLSFSAHKFYGPKGVGALYVSARARPWLEPLLFGGGQERGLRPGTLPTPLIVGFGVAARLARERLAHDAIALEDLAKRFRSALRSAAGVRFNDHPQFRVPGLVSVSIEGVEGESLMAALPQLALASGAACDSASGEPSYVLRALGVPLEQARSTLRVSFGRDNTADDADRAAAAIRRALEQLRSRDAPGTPPGAGWQVGEAGSIREGARVRCFVRRGPEGRIEALEFRAAACPHTERVLGWLSQRAPGLHPDDPSIGTPLKWQRACEVPTEKLGRLILVEDAMRRAFAASALIS